MNRGTVRDESPDGYTAFPTTQAVSPIRPSIFERLLGMAAACFVAAMLIYFAVHLIESVLPALLIMIAVIAGAAGIMWWLRSRSNSW